MDEGRSKSVLSEFAIASLVIGIISFINLAGMEKAIVAIVFGALALKRMKKDNQILGRKLATAGVILGIFSVVATTTFLIKYLPQIKQQIRQMQREDTLMREDKGIGGSRESNEATRTKLY